jgi:hypothetical protein
MSATIWIHYSRPRPQWYRLSAEQQSERRDAWHTVEKVSIEGGAKRVGSYHIRGQHDFQTVDLWQFASPEAAFDHWARLTAVGYNELFAFSNNVGMALENQTP